MNKGAALNYKTNPKTKRTQNGWHLQAQLVGAKIRNEPKMEHSNMKIQNKPIFLSICEICEICGFDLCKTKPNLLWPLCTGLS